MELASEVVLRLILLIISAVTAGWLLPYLRKKMGEENASRAAYWIQCAVECAEEQLKGERRGKEKKEYVLEAAREVLKEEKITLSQKQMDLLIEEAVRILHRQQGE